MASSWAQVAPVMASAVSLVTFLATGAQAPLRRVAMWARQAGLPGTGGLGKGGRAVAVVARVARAARRRVGREGIACVEREEREAGREKRERVRRECCSRTPLTSQKKVRVLKFVPARDTPVFGAPRGRNP